MEASERELEPEAQVFTPKEFRQVLGVFATGVTLVTTRTPGPAYGMTANAFSSLSLEPPLVLVCASRTAQGREWIESNRAFAVNILALDQEELSTFFASSNRPRDSVAFRHFPYKKGPSGSPILDGVAGFIDCELESSHEAGDHVILIGKVLALGCDPDAPPLLFHGGGYRRLADVAPAPEHLAG